MIRRIQGTADDQSKSPGVFLVPLRYFHCTASGFPLSRISYRVVFADHGDQNAYPACRLCKYAYLHLYCANLSEVASGDPYSWSTMEDLLFLVLISFRRWWAFSWIIRCHPGLKFRNLLCRSTFSPSWRTYRLPKVQIRKRGGTEQFMLMRSAC